MPFTLRSGCAESNAHYRASESLLTPERLPIAPMPKYHLPVYPPPTIGNGKDKDANYLPGCSLFPPACGLSTMHLPQEEG